MNDKLSINCGKCQSKDCDQCYPPFKRKRFMTLPEALKKVEAKKQKRYLDEHTSNDWIDICEEILSEEEFNGAMKFTIGKYMKRLGKKDANVQEITKIADYANRWKEVQERRDGC